LSFAAVPTGRCIKDYFLNYKPYPRHFTLDLQRNSIEFHRSASEPWNVTLLSGQTTMSAERLKECVAGSTFCLTNGKCLSNVNIRELIRFHRQEAALATVTDAQEPGRFAATDLSSERPRAARLLEKDVRGRQMINTGFLVLEPESLDIVEGDSTSWETDLLARLIRQDQLAVYRHHGYLRRMDTLRDQEALQKEWDSGRPTWCVWNDEHANSRKVLPGGDQPLITAAAQI
jgi:glucose-1-phosphate cytidylyltransferase